jgi:predicted alpha/beta-fold hydrolase
MPVIASSYTGSPLYLYNGHLQTVVPSMFRKVPGVEYERERLTLADGDFIDIDWIEQAASATKRRLLIVTHGLEGDSHRHYIRGTAKLFAEHGYDVLAWNCRSCSGEMNRAFRLYNHGEIGDISELIQHALRTKHYQEIVMVGYSMGGNITLKYLGVHGKNAPDVIQKAVAVSAPCDLVASAKLLDLPSNKLYRNRFMKKLLVKIRQKADAFPGTLNLEKLAEVKVWRDFDNFFSAPVNGYRDADDFYEQASAVNFMPGIAIPTLVLNAQNDPILSPECAPADLAQKHPQIFVETPRTGGHCGFLVPRDLHTYSERRALAFASERL